VFARTYLFIYLFIYFVTSWYFTVSSRKPHAQPPTLRTILVSCPRLLIEDIHSYLAYLDAVTSIHKLRTSQCHVYRDSHNMEKQSAIFKTLWKWWS